MGDSCLGEKVPRTPSLTTYPPSRNYGLVLHVLPASNSPSYKELPKDFRMDFRVVIRNALERIEDGLVNEL